MEIKDYSENRLIQINKTGDWYKAEISQMVVEHVAAVFSENNESMELTLRNINTVKTATIFLKV